MKKYTVLIHYSEPRVETYTTYARDGESATQAVMAEFLDEYKNDKVKLERAEVVS